MSQNSQEDTCLFFNKVAGFSNFIKHLQTLILDNLLPGFQILQSTPANFKNKN